MMCLLEQSGSIVLNVLSSLNDSTDVGVSDRSLDDQRFDALYIIE